VIRKEGKGDVAVCGVFEADCDAEDEEAEERNENGVMDVCRSFTVDVVEEEEEGVLTPGEGEREVEEDG
jgi:hypothetical protein